MGRSIEIGGSVEAVQTGQPKVGKVPFHVSDDYSGLLLLLPLRPAILTSA
jgi:hypothetical protein